VNSIRIKVRFLSPYFRDLAGVGEEEVLLGEGSSLRALLGKLRELHGERLYEQLYDEETGEVRSGVLLVVNGRLASSVNEVLRDGDMVAITIAYEGGAPIAG